MIFFFFAQNIDCGYTEAVLTRTHNLCFTIYKWGVRGVFVTRIRFRDGLVK